MLENINLTVFSFGHISWVLMVFILIALIYYLFKDKSEKTQYLFLLSLIILAWIVHFSRYFLEPNLKNYELFFTDFCGFSTFVYPLFFLSRKHVFKDYMFYASSIFAFLSLMYPNNIEGDPIFVFNSLRFFYAHLALVAVPFLMVVWKLHTPNIKNIPYVFLILVIAAWYNLALSAFFVEVGLVDHLINFGGLWGNTDSIYRIAEKFAPFLVYSKEINNQIVEVPIPFFYILPATIVIMIPSWIIMSLPFLKTPMKTIGIKDILNTSIK